MTEGYTVKDLDFPNALCTDFHFEMNKKINDNGYHLAPKVDDYDPGKSKYLRPSSDCNCKICTIAKMTGLAYQWMVKKKKGRPVVAEKMTPMCYKICSNCFQQIFQRSNHSESKCRICRQNKVSRIEDWLRSQTKLQRVTSRGIKNPGYTLLSILGTKKQKRS